MAAAEKEADGPAIRALGALFTVSQVYLRDDAEGSGLEVSDRRGSLKEQDESTRSAITSDANISVKQETDYCSSLEDLELARQMAALGLPISFSTTKQRKVATLEKKKGMLAKSKLAHNDIEDQVPEFSKVEHKRCSFPEVLHDSTNLPVSLNSTECEHVFSDRDALDEHSRSNVEFDAVLICEAAVTMSEVGEREARDDLITLEHVIDKDQASSIDIGAENLGQNGSSDAGRSSQDVPEDSAAECYSELPEKQDSDDASLCWEFGDWRVIWDDYYRRNYFYNTKTKEATWYAPPGLEYFASSCSISTSNGLSADAVEQQSGFYIDCGADRDQDAKVIQAEYDALQENKNVISQTLSNFSAKTDSVNCPSTTCVSDTLDMITNGNEVSDNLLLCHAAHINDNTIDELDIAVPSDKQKAEVTCNEALNVPDVSVGVATNSCLTTSSNEVGLDGGGIEACMMGDMDDNHEIATIKTRRRARHQSQLRLQGTLGDLSADIFKYWCQRYSLFSQYDSGIKMDEEGWFSVTPEAIARHHATRCGGGIVIDCFAGVGGNAIQFAMMSNHVIAIDIDPQKVEFAYHNSIIYGVNDKIDFVHGDFFRMAAHLKGDTVFLSPPWGGPDYSKVQTYDIRSMLKPHDGYLLFKTATRIASKVLLYLPRNVDLNQLAELSLSVYPPWMVEVEKNILNGKFKAVTVYFSSPT